MLTLFRRHYDANTEEMDSFQLIQPSAILAPYVKHYWMMTVSSPAMASERIFPTGMICLMFHRGERIFLSNDNQLQPRAFVGGQGVSYTDLAYCGTVDMISVEFRPAGAKAFFKIPMIELYGKNIAIEVFSDKQLLELQNRLAESPDTQTCISLIEQFLLQRLYHSEHDNVKRINAVIQSIYSGQRNIKTLAQTACLGYKQFKRIFADVIGANPKDYLRVIRFQQALNTLENQPKISLIQLAFDCGYYDQPHFIKDFKQFSGYAPTEYKALLAEKQI